MTEVIATKASPPGLFSTTTGWPHFADRLSANTRAVISAPEPGPSGMTTLTARCAIAFLRRAVAWFAERGVTIRAVMSDNGSAYIAHTHRKALAELGLKHLCIRPYRPRTNGKAERFIQTLLNEWAYERIYGSSTERASTLPLFLERYNFRRPHGSLGHQPPASRLTNLVRNNT